MTNKITDVKGDSLSKLVQVRAAMLGIHLKWTGQAIPDIDLLCTEYFHRKTLNECLWNGLRTLLEMPGLKELPEPIYAQILSIVLRSQANFELERVMKLGNPASPPLTPGPAPVSLLPGPTI